MFTRNTGPARRRPAPDPTRVALPALILALGMVGCATAPAEGVAPVGEPPAEAAAPESDGFSRDVLYKLLVAEFAGREGQLSLALDNYLDVARSTRSAQAAERAVRIAVFARDEQRGLQAAELWTQIDAESLEAQQVYAALLMRTGDTERAVTALSALVPRLEEGTAGQAFARIGDLLAREKDRSTALEVMARLVEHHPHDPKAQFAFGHLLARAGEFDKAREVFQEVVRLDPDNEQAVVFLARILQRQGDTEAALGTLAGALERHEDAATVRMTYARLLVDARRYDEARTQFERLSETDPDNGDVQYALGLLLLQTNHLDDAEQRFRKLVNDPERREAAWYYIGQINESRKQYAEALAAYRKVRDGEHRLNAQVRAAVLMAEQGDVAAARAHLHGLRGENHQEVVRIYRAEAEILVRAEDFPTAMGVYDSALEEFPQDGDLLYARAMLAEKLDLLDVLEADLRDILTREPNNADALNALGYTLADRTDRLEEALALIQRAYDLKPDDHYIVDSLGWVLYRLGRHQEALKHLRRAMELNPDAEIAAHLGEVLWVMGNKEAAREVWDSALKSTPDDKRLLDIKKRFGL